MYTFRIAFAALLLLGSPATFAKDCKATASMPLGGHYKPDAPYKVDVSQGLVVKGRVLSAEGCAPIAHAKIDHWQANSEGFYTDNLRAHLLSGADGEYALQTEWPGTSTPHIHFIVSADGYKELVTQWVGRKSVEEITIDFVLARILHQRATKSNIRQVVE